MKFYDKVKWILGILMIFILVIATNLIDRNNFSRVKESLATIYEDRLIAKDLIFELNNLIQEKEIAIATSNAIFFEVENSQINKDIEKLISKFEQTKLTTDEVYILKDLKKNLVLSRKSEISFVNTEFVQKTALSNSITKIKDNLHDLSKIQMSEGARQMSISKKALDNVELFSQIEIYILIILAILIQVIIIYKPRVKSKNE
jgi:hypothetical protein